MLVLDTDLLTLMEWPEGEEAARLERHLDQHPDKEITTTIISFEEQTRGWLAFLAKARTLFQEVEAYARLRRHLDVFRPIHVLDFDERAATELQRLRKNRTRIGTMDLKIAAIVLAQDATLLTKNLGDFRKVPGLKVEDWTT